MGLLVTILAYAIWSVVPIYWKQLAHVSPLELIMHRVVWSLVFALMLIGGRRRFRLYLDTLRTPRRLLVHGTAAVAIFVNWLTFVWAVNNGRIIDTSLGYFLCPLVSVLMARLILKESLGWLQWTAVACASAGVFSMIIQAGAVPMPALLIALSWSCYSLLKKRMALGPITALGVETTLLAPVAIGYLMVAGIRGTGSLSLHDWSNNLWLLSTGVITALPLLLFAQGARHVRLTTLGLLQYLVPSCTFLIAVFLYDEPFTRARIIGFSFIWTGLALYLLSSLGKPRQREPVPAPPGTIRT